MKVRCGFVSNSSSSSFIVEVAGKSGSEDHPSWLATKEDVEKLLTYGFRPTRHHCPSSLEANSRYHVARSTKRPRLKRFYALGYSVTCNEDDVIDFLTENDIPFKAACHYGHESVFFKKGDKHTLHIRNPGVAYEMYGECEYEKPPKSVTTKIPIKEKQDEDA